MIKKEKARHLIIGASLVFILSGFIMTRVEEPKASEVKIVEVPVEVRVEVPAEIDEDYIREQAKLLGIKLNEEIKERVVHLKTLYLNEKTSYDIARRLEKEGVIEDFEAFNRYIYEQNKSRRLRTGYREFKLGSSYEEALLALTD